MRLPAERRRLAGQHLGQGGFARAVRPQQRDAVLRRDGQVDSADDGRPRIAAGGVFHRQQRTRSLERGGEFELERAVDVRRYDALHAFQHLDAALCLARFGGAGAKSVHEGGDLRDAPHLPHLQRLLQRQFLGALLLELRVVAGVGVDGAVLDVQHPVDDGIEEFAIVGDHEQRALKRRQPILQPHDGVQIQVIGGLIQQQ